VIQSEKKKTGNINFIFCSDEYLLSLNEKYLNHHYYTDVLTFDQSSDRQTVSGDIYISVDRVKENAVTHQKSEHQKAKTENELYRVMIHGILHLLGYDDKTPSAKKKMRAKEDECLKLLETLTPAVRY